MTGQTGIIMSTEMPLRDWHPQGRGRYLEGDNSMRKSTRALPNSPYVATMIGCRFGRLTVKSFAGWKHFPCGTRQPEVLCGCDCGSEIVAMASNVKSLHTTSCGCGSSRLKRTRLKHGNALKSGASQEYRAWRDMNNRCNRPTTKAFQNYGGRGIKVCDRWMEGQEGAFERFLSDIGPAPLKGYTLDRIDVNGNYEPGNCRWATRHTQMRNMRKNVWITGFGRTQIIADWAREFGVPNSTIRYWVVLRGLSLEEAAKKL